MKNELIIVNDPKSLFSEAIRTLRTNLQFSLVANNANGFTVGTESVTVTGGTGYTVTAKKEDITEVSGITDGLAVSGSSGSSFDVVTSAAGTFKFGGKEYVATASAKKQKLIMYL